MARPMLHLTSMENFKAQKFSGSRSFDLNHYSVLGIFPYQVYGLDAEMKKTRNALYVQLRNNSTKETRIFYCSEVKIENV